MPFDADYVTFAAMEQLSKAKAKWIRSLKDRKTRDEEGFFVVEGKKMVTEALQSGWDAELVAVSDQEIVLPFHNETFTLSRKELEGISTLDSPEGVLAVIQYPQGGHYQREAKLAEPPIGRAFVLDGIQDPGNLGTIIRIADWFGFSAVICGPGTADCFNPKALRASMGSIFRVQMLYTSTLEPFVRAFAEKIAVADMQGETAEKHALKGRPFILLGSEGKGVSPELKAIPGLKTVTIPSHGGAESLNVAVSAGILGFLSAQ